MSAALSRSASAQTTSAFLPPISSWVRTHGATLAWMASPTAVEPVNVTASTRLSETIALPTSAWPWTSASAPPGTPASSSASTSRWPSSGVTSLGLKITPLPAASAGPSLREGMLSGKFHGVIAATTPTGSRG